MLELDEGIHELVGNWTAPWGRSWSQGTTKQNFSGGQPHQKGTYQKDKGWLGKHVVLQQTLSIPCNNLSIVGKGKGKTIILGGLVVENRSMQAGSLRVTGKGRSMQAGKGRSLRVTGVTVKNPHGYGLLAYGVGTKIEISRVTIEECMNSGLNAYRGAKLNAKDCHFCQNGTDGVCVDGSLTTARLTNCTSHHNKSDGVRANWGAVVDLMGERTSVHDNERYGLSAWHYSCDFCAEISTDVVPFGGSSRRRRCRSKHEKVHGSTINVYQPCVLVSHGNKKQNIFRDPPSWLHVSRYGNIILPVIRIEQPKAADDATE